MRRRKSIADDLWLQSWPTRLTPLVDVVCIAGAGAGASRFKPWLPLLPGFCAMHVAQLPGRENRIEEPAVDDVATVVANLAEAVTRQTNRHRPLVLFGHSMGAVLAYELTHALQQQGRQADALLLSATTPPSGQSDRPAPSDEELKRLLLAFDPANRSIVENADLFASLAPALRADFQLLRRHSISGDRTLGSVSCVLMSGNQDPVVPGEAVALWKGFLGADVAQHEFEGGHQFPFQESVGEVTAELGRVAKGRLAL